jgi:membrane protease YdiL (CAAX protease family)
MGLIAFFGAMLVLTVMGPFLSDTGMYDDLLDSNPLIFIFAVVIFAPLSETFVMALFFALAKFVTKDVQKLAIVSALCWGALHLFNAPANGIAVIWPFYIMSRAYLAWRPLGFWKAYGITALIHAIHNTPPAIAFLLYMMQSQDPAATSIENL